jgi:two-component system sensor histidine kinase AlgZ
MHPVLATRYRIALYVLLWVPIGALVGSLLAGAAHLAWFEAAALVVPICIFYGFICLSPWYMCRVLPLGTANLPNIVFSHIVAGVVAGLWWTASAWLVSSVLSRFFFPTLGARLGPQLKLIAALGCLLYLLAVTLHYVLLSLQHSRAAETREQEARVLAREAELKALKAQINPHFLFNSLNSISALAMADGARAREMCIRLSEFLRTTLALAEKETIPLADELALARTYLDVEQVRFGARLRVEQRIEPACKVCPVPSLLLQPLVENAVKHGIAGLIEGGTIWIEASLRDGWLRVAVQNPFDPDGVPARKSGLGLANVRARLEARYEDRARMETTSEAGSFRVELRIPCAFWEGSFQRLDAVLDEMKTEP